MVTLLLRDHIVLECLANGMSKAAIASKLGIARAIVGKIVRRLERQGLVIVDISHYPHQVQVVGGVTNNGGGSSQGYITSGIGGVTTPAWGLRNYAIKLTFTGPAPPWRPFRAGWRGGQAFLLYARNCRCEAYIGSKGARTLVIYAPKDMQGDTPRALEFEANSYCERTANLLAEKLGWQLGSQRTMLGQVVPIKKGEFEANHLKEYAVKLRDLHLTPIHTEHGKIDRSPKPAAWQVFGREWAERTLETPAEIDRINASLDKHLMALAKIEKAVEIITKRLDEMKVL